MDMISRILVAIDGSEPSFHALDYAIEFAQKWKAELLVLSVVPPITYMFDPMGSPLLDYEAMKDQAKKIYKSKLENAEKDLKKVPKVNYRTIIEFGRPCIKINEVAINEAVDLIIVGSSGLGGITGYILGSTSNRVANHCKMPILIIK